MNLYDTVKALGAIRTEKYPQGITVAFELGVHHACDLQSNCPLAIGLRRFITEAGLTLEEILEGYHAVHNPEPFSYELPEINATIQVKIAGKTIDLDLTGEEIAPTLRTTIDRKLSDLDRAIRSMREIGFRLYGTYLHEIHKERERQALPLIPFNHLDLIQSGCMVATDGNDYVFYLPSRYKPLYLVDGGIRFKLDDKDVITLERKIFIRFTISSGYQFIRASVMDERGEKLQHYHGNNSDCWGSVRLPEEWDGSLTSLTNLAYTLGMSLGTINYNSLLVREPLGMPASFELRGRCTEVGKEGELGAGGGEQLEHTQWGRPHWGGG